ncbi:MAG: hypothetical protein KDA87_14570 [Planctomycetales bacterium]|nr:hypothetical protein [Planctomycetales bacterium]
MVDDPHQERLIVMLCAAFQSLSCLGTVGLLFAFPPPERSQAIMLLITTQICLLVSFLNTTMLGALGTRAGMVSFARFLLWVPGMAMACLAMYCIFLFARS